MLGKLVSTRVLGAVVPALLVAGGVAGASGKLPVFLSDSSTPSTTTSTTVDSTTTTSTTVDSTTTTTTAAPAAPDTPSGSSSPTRGPDVTGPAAFGLCTAYSHGHGAKNGVAFQNLQTAATGAGESVTQFCASATPGGKGASGAGAAGDSTTTTQADSGTGGDSGSTTTTTAAG